MYIFSSNAQTATKDMFFSWVENFKKKIFFYFFPNYFNNQKKVSFLSFLALYTLLSFIINDLQNKKVAFDESILAFRRVFWRLTFVYTRQPENNTKRHQKTTQQTKKFDNSIYSSYNAANLNQPTQHRGNHANTI